MDRTERIKGRPPKPSADGTRIMYYDTELHRTLVEKLPGFVQGGRLAVARLAKEMGYSAYAIYRTLQDNRLSPRAINKIIEITEKGGSPEDARLVKDDLLKFLLN